MSKRLFMTAVAILFATGLTLAAPKGKEGTWAGWVTDTHCGAKGANADHAACAKKCVEQDGAKYALYDNATKKVYVLEPQDQAAAHVAQHVRVKGSLEGDTITVSSIEEAPAGKMQK